MAEERSGLPWSEAEDYVLKQLTDCPIGTEKILSIGTIARIFGRTESGIACRIEKLRGKSPDAVYTWKEVKTEFKVDPIGVLDRPGVAFWLVWNPRGGVPIVRHPSMHHAANEASRLMREGEFEIGIPKALYILKAVEKFEEKPVPTYTRSALL
jgi:hypothetical protein